MIVIVRGVYVHIPFCHQICHYCDFNKVFFENQPVDAYIESLGEEMRLRTIQDPQMFRQIETVFLGGGTPTALTPIQLARLLELIHLYVPMSHVIEFTAEANPDELSLEKLEVLRRGGVNRLSMGVQSFDEALLKKLGRIHSNDHVYTAIDNARQIGFQNISIDLMYGLPGQTMEQWKDSLQQAFALQLPHYSAYSLIVEPKTIFYNDYTKGRLRLPTEDIEADMYHLLMDKMEAKGLKQYEISNFAHKGFASVHNNIYWDNDEYAGFGAGAHGYINGVRYSNYGPLKKYMGTITDGRLPILQQHEVSNEERCEEQMFLGLRKVEGVSFQAFQHKCGQSMQTMYSSVITKLQVEQLLEVDKIGVRLTRQGRFVGNEVFQQFLLED